MTQRMSRMFVVVLLILVVVCLNKLLTNWGVEGSRVAIGDESELESEIGKEKRRKRRMGEQLRARNRAASSPIWKMK